MMRLFNPGLLRHNLTIIGSGDDDASADDEFADAPAVVGGNTIKAYVKAKMGEEKAASKDSAVRSVFRWQIIARRPAALAAGLDVGALVSTPEDGKMRVVSLGRKDVMGRYIIAEAERIA